MSRIGGRALLASGHRLSPLRHSTRLAASAHPRTPIPASNAGHCRRNLSLARDRDVLAVQYRSSGQLRGIRPMFQTVTGGGVSSSRLPRVRPISNSTHILETPNVEVLPDAPPYPCPFLTDEEIHTYLTTLYARCWTVQPSMSAEKAKAAPELVKTFSFSPSQALDDFLRRIEDITRSENHHAVLEKSPSTPSVIIRVHTHSGLRPASHPGEKRKERVQPGITLRDVRFAYLVERALGDGAPAQHAELTPADIAAQPRSAEGVESRRYAAEMHARI